MRDNPLSWNAKLIMHGKTATGSIYIKELVDYPGIQVLDTYDRKTGNTRVVLFEDEEYPDVDAAVKVWNAYKAAVEAL